MIGKTVRVVVDRPLGSCHPKHEDIYYSVNYGYIPGVMAADGEAQDAYILGVSEPLKEFTGRVIAIIHRLDDVEDKWVVAPENAVFTKAEIMERVAFQERYFRTEIIIMAIRRAEAEDKGQISEYDRHIGAARLDVCIREGMVDVLCVGGRIAGVLRYNLFWQSVPFLDLLYIDEAFRGQGWGTKMMIHWEEAMKEKGYPYVMLSTQEDETAKFFYGKIGYRRIGAFLPPEQDADEIMYLKMLN